ncbi:MAG: hypothetical protein ACI4JA_08205 [Oscillospiraceae bacterium]
MPVSKKRKYKKRRKAAKPTNTTAFAVYGSDNLKGLNSDRDGSDILIGSGEELRKAFNSLFD